MITKQPNAVEAHRPQRHAVTDIIVRDDDLGRPATPGNRGGFERVIRELGTGRVGIVLAVDVSRFTRDSLDWQRLLDACSQADTLIATDDDLYDPKDLQS